MLHRNPRTEPLGSEVPKGPTPGEGSSRFCSGVPRGQQVKEERLGVCSHVVCKPRSCSQSYIWRERGKPLQTVSLDAPLCYGDPVPGAAPKVLTSGALARHGKTGRSYKSKMVLPCFLYAETVFLSFSLHCEIECYLQVKRSTDNEFFSESSGNGMYGVMTPFLGKKKKAYWLSAWRWLLGSFPCSVPGLKPEYLWHWDPLRILTQP